jgi:hypothetical protein
MNSVLKRCYKNYANPSPPSSEPRYCKFSIQSLRVCHVRSKAPVSYATHPRNLFLHCSPQNECNKGELCINRRAGSVHSRYLWRRNEQLEQQRQESKWEVAQDTEPASNALYLRSPALPDISKDAQTISLKDLMKENQANTATAGAASRPSSITELTRTSPPDLQSSSVGLEKSEDQSPPSAKQHVLTYHDPSPEPDQHERNNSAGNSCNAEYSSTESGEDSSLRSAKQQPPFPICQGLTHRNRKHHLQQRSGCRPRSALRISSTGLLAGPARTTPGRRQNPLPSPKAPQRAAQGVDAD